MEKSKLKTGMRVITAKGEDLLILKGCEYSICNGEDITCQPRIKEGKIEYWDFYSLSNWNEDLTSCSNLKDLAIIEVKNIQGITIWELTPEKEFELDGVTYSESTLRSIIKKATAGD